MQKLFLNDRVANGEMYSADWDGMLEESRAVVVTKIFNMNRFNIQKQSNRQFANISKS